MFPKHSLDNQGSATAAGIVHGDINNYHYAASVTSLTITKKVIFGYYESWAEYEIDPIKRFSLEDIKEEKLTHVAYAYIKINDDGSVYLGDVENTKSKRFLQFLHLKNRNPKLKLLISLGGWMENANIFQEVFGDDTKLTRLLEGLVELFEEFKFDGLDLVWVYPEQRHKNLFTKFFAKLRYKFGSSFILSAVIGAASPIGETYDFKELNKLLDFYNILAYGFLTNIPCTQHNAPMEALKELNRELIREQVDFKKILLGVELGGKKFTLKDPRDNQPGAESVGTPTLIKSIEINDLFKTTKWECVCEARGDYAYAFCDNRWISYENCETVKCKAKFAAKNMAGVVMMALNYEGSGENPLLDAIYEELNK